MMRHKTTLAIVNRGFWPEGQVIGEGLLQFAEKAAEEHNVCVITQAHGNLVAKLASAGRGRGVRILACRSLTTSASGVVRRMVEAAIFMLWTFVSLLRISPANVYVSTNPPVLVPFVVAIYCRLFNARYVYHLQDIHPEAASIVVPLNGVLFRIFSCIDNFTLRHADTIITLSEDMKDYVRLRSNTSSPICLVDNPSFEVSPVPFYSRTCDVVFCGNAGRLQRIPLLLSAITDYLKKGGKLRFTFAGGGVYANDVKVLADEFDQVDYLGVITAEEAAQLVNRHRWALLPIEDDVTRYAFPSKSSGYALSGAGILAVCGHQTSVAKWVEEHRVGIVCAADKDALVDCFFSLEDKTGDSFRMSADMRKKLQLSHFAQQLSRFSVPEFEKGLNPEC